MSPLAKWALAKCPDTVAITPIGIWAIAFPGLCNNFTHLYFRNPSHCCSQNIVTRKTIGVNEDTAVSGIKQAKYAIKYATHHK